MERICYIPVPCTERLPEKEGWYNLTTNSLPNSAGRSWFNGKEFKLRNECQDYSNLLANGYELYWLEPQPIPVSGYTENQMNEYAKEYGKSIMKNININYACNLENHHKLDALVIDAYMPDLPKPEGQDESKYWKSCFKSAQSAIVGMNDDEIKKFIKKEFPNENHIQHGFMMSAVQLYRDRFKSGNIITEGQPSENQVGYKIVKGKHLKIGDIMITANVYGVFEKTTLTDLRIKAYQQYPDGSYMVTLPFPEGQPKESVNVKMLEALKESLSRLECFDDKPETYGDIIKLIKSAIANAEKENIHE